VPSMAVLVGKANWWPSKKLPGVESKPEKVPAAVPADTADG